MAQEDKPARTGIDNQLVLDFISEKAKESGIDLFREPDLISQLSGGTVREPMRLFRQLINDSTFRYRLYLSILMAIKKHQYMEPGNTKVVPELRFQFHVSDFMPSYVAQTSSVHLKRWVDGLLEQKIKVEVPLANGDIEYTGMNVYSMARYSRGNVIFIINPHVAPMFLELGRDFSEIELSNALKLNSVYAQRLYTIVMRHVGYKKSFKLTLTDFREIMVLTEPVHKEWRYIKSKILDPSVQHINTQTSNVSLSYTAVKVKAGDYTLHFTIDVLAAIESEEPADQTLKWIQDAGDLTLQEKREYVEQQLTTRFQDFTKNEVVTILSNPLFIDRFCMAEAYIQGRTGMRQIKPDKQSAYMRKTIFNPTQKALKMELLRKR